jgi:hypothetical protein
MTDATRNQRISPRRVAGTAGRFTAPERPTRHAGPPEWATARWKHRVEAEARSRLKREVRDVGAARR